MASPGGWLAGRWRYAHRNRKHNRWAVALLDVQPQDHILEMGFGPGLAIRELARRATRRFRAWNGRRRGGLDRRYAAAAPWRDETGVHWWLRAVDVGFVPAVVHLRPRPAAGCGCVALPIRSGGAGPAAGCRAGAGRPRRHDRGGAWLRQAGRRLRLLEGSRAERVAGHRHHGGVRAGDRGVSAAPRVVRFTARRETAGRRHA